MPVDLLDHLYNPNYYSIIKRRHHRIPNRGSTDDISLLSQNMYVVCVQFLFLLCLHSPPSSGPNKLACNRYQPKIGNLQEEIRGKTKPDSQS